ncbi:MAG: hypothetical protein EBU84_06490 [Actinobacteria bacterium]|nr:hypothetical protein [Actinomycetota bacterium]
MLPTPPVSLLAIARQVEVRLAEVIDTERAKWVAFEPQLATPFDEMRRLVLAGGKRFVQARAGDVVLPFSLAT